MKRGPADAVRGPASKEFEIDSRQCEFINSALSDKVDVSMAAVLAINEGICYTGQYPRHKGFILAKHEAKLMLHAEKGTGQLSGHSSSAARCLP